ncbi:hypothetical protein DSECCO2_646880 [anaerobic digester metagenome]
MSAVHLFPIHLGGRQIFGYQQNDGRQESLGGIVEKLILPVVLAAGVDDGFGDDLGVFLRLGLCHKVVFVGKVSVHVGIDQLEHIVAVGTGGISKVNDRHMVAVVVTGNGAIVAVEVPLGISGQKTHAAGAGIFQIRVQEKGRLAHTRRANHEAVDVIGVHQRRDLIFRSCTAEDDALLRNSGEAFSLPPQLRLEGNVLINAFDFLLGGKARRAMLAIAHRAGLDSIEGVIVRQKRKAADDEKHHGGRSK